MLIYRFKISSEEHEEFLREICIQPGQKFIDFYQTILESAELIPAQQASFYLTDKKYKKGKEITLYRIEKKVRRYDAEMDEIVDITIIPKLMKDSKLKDYIEDPHQRMIFEYQGWESFTFLIELLKIMHSDEEGLYPKCVKWVGDLPKKTELFITEVKEEDIRIQSELLKQEIPDTDPLAKLDGIEENEAELAQIEDQLSNILFDETEKELEIPLPPSGSKLRKKPNVNAVESDDIFHEEEEIEDEDEKEDFSDGMEHLEDYDNIENIEIKYAKFSDEIDDD
ncbi:MAG: hypothetical protein JXA23_01215 [Bacteroidales bacterium]|nr:hypothetical protein [Bacteroidales bacterium]